eukprot:1139909-Pelagomonas_calceolata.AAC.5
MALDMLTVKPWTQCFFSDLVKGRIAISATLMQWQRESGPGGWQLQWQLIQLLQGKATQAVHTSSVD